MSEHEAVNLAELADELAAGAAEHTSGRSARSVLHGDHLRAVVMALDTGRDLAEHTAPGPAVLQVLRGEPELRWEGNALPLSAGDLVPIPDAVHSVHARTACVFLLTISLPG